MGTQRSCQDRAPQSKNNHKLQGEAMGEGDGMTLQSPARDVHAAKERLPLGTVGQCSAYDAPTELVY